MNILDAIYTRQSVGNVRPDAVPREVIEQLLGAAVQAPSHYKTRPWRFTVLTGKGRERLGEVLVQSLLRRNPDAPEALLESERKMPLRAPLLIAVGIDKPDQPKVIEIENVCAGAAAVQNLLLAAHALGLAAKWRTGSCAYNEDVKAFLGLEPDQHLIALVYIGYPESEREPLQRPDYSDRVTWLDN